MGFVFGKYTIYLEFEDGEKGYLMGLKGDHAMITSQIANAEKWMTSAAAENYFHSHDVRYAKNADYSPIKAAYVASDGKYFRM